MSPSTWRAAHVVAVLGGVALTVLYLDRYVNFYALPGRVPGFPLGWWGWFDQSKYIESARALARLDFASARHWYPLGYAVLGAPFTRVTTLHPFVVVDLACLLASYAGFWAFAARLGIGAGWRVAIFLGSIASARAIFAQWVIPWNTSPASALIWLLLACVAAQMQGSRRPLVIGLLAACLPLMRPTDALLSLLCVAAALFANPREAPRQLLRMVLGGLVPLLAYGWLHWRIYGFAASEYMRESRDIGFTLHDLGWKAYIILIDPRAWFLDGEGLLRRAPFLALTLGGLAVAWAHGRAAGLLAILLVVHSIVYLAYVDLLPTGLWRYNNVHYWQWAMPGAGLLGFLLVRDLVRWRAAPAFPLAPAALAVSLPLLCAQIVPAAVTEATPAKMLAYSGTPPGFDQSYFAPLAIDDRLGPLHAIRDMRAIPVPFGLRAFALTRDFVGTPVWQTAPAGWTSAAPPARFAERLRIGRPCWLRWVQCTKALNDQLPPEPRG